MGSNVSAKVWASTLAAAVVSCLVWLISLAGVDVPTEVAAALVVIATFVAGYLKVDPDRAA